MCGVACLWSPGADPALVRERLSHMVGRLHHRGPDDQGMVHDDAAAPALGHRRLAIVDLSPLGHQPMVSADGRWQLVFNGEIYNAPALAQELRAMGVAFRGHSDTEVMVEGIARWGVTATLARARGMFAVAVWDRQQQVLTVARDRFGEKPLYVGRWTDAAGRGWFAAASELKAFTALDDFPQRIDGQAVQAFFASGFVPAPLSIWRDVRKLPPGTSMEIRQGLPGPVRLWWSPVQAWHEGRAHGVLAGMAAVDAVDTVLREAVRDQLVADVPVGILLSGGIDSAVVAALATQVGRTAPQTFTIGFPEAGFDESPHAAAVAQALGCRQESLVCTASDAQAMVPRLAGIYDEPFADASQVPTLLVAALARRQVTVALGGDGGDELFGGYVRYRHTQRAWSLVGRMPAPFRRAAGAVLAPIPAAWWRWALAPVDALRPRRSLENTAAGKAAKFAGLLAAHDRRECYRRIIDHEPHRRAALLPYLHGWHHDGVDQVGDHDLPHVLDQMTYLPDDILVKVDRAAMAFGLEVRAPLLDHRLAVLAARLPAEAKVGKRVLTEVLARYLPPALWRRPKMGFSMPLDVWLAGPLRPWAEALLQDPCVAQDGILDPHETLRMWQDFVAGSHHQRYRLWDRLMWIAWRRDHPRAHYDGAAG